MEPLFRTDTITSSAKIGATGVRNIRKIVVGAQTGNATAKFHNSADNSGTILLTVSALSDDECEIDLAKVGGLVFDTALYCELAGTGAIAYVWYE